MKRRAVLRSLASGCTLLAAGCSAFQESPGKIDFSIENARRERLTVRVRFVRPDVSDHFDAIGYGEQFDLPPGGEIFRDAVATNQPYRFEVEVDGEGSGRSFTSHHSHYRPFEQSGDRLVEVVLYQDGVRFRP